MNTEKSGKETAAFWIDRLGLLPHPEGGYYREVFRSEKLVNRVNQIGSRSALTSIYYLIENEDHSGFHRIASDELWYFHAGAPLHIHVITGSGEHKTRELSDSDTCSLSLAVDAGQWFAAEIASGQGFTLVSCAVAPGFEFSEFEMAQKEQMFRLYPQHTALLERLCH